VSKLGRICLEQLGVIRESDHAAMVIKVFWRLAKSEPSRSGADFRRYIQVMRTLQSTYWLEPAGSHGVWGLDDYHFLPFLFGSAQLKGMCLISQGCFSLKYFPGHKYLRPKSIHDHEVVEECSKDYMYFGCIQFINSVRLTRSAVNHFQSVAYMPTQVKTASLRWHSPMLDDISAVRTFCSG
jgi:serine/threonine-protein phosphatase 2A activator